MAQLTSQLLLTCACEGIHTYYYSNRPGQYQCVPMAPEEEAELLRVISYHFQEQCWNHQHGKERVVSDKVYGPEMKE